MEKTRTLPVSMKSGLVFLALASGLAMARAWTNGLAWPIAGFLAVAACCGITWAAALRKKHILAIISILAMATGALIGRIAPAPDTDWVNPRAYYAIEGTVSGYGASLTDAERFYLKDATAELDGTIKHIPGLLAVTDYGSHGEKRQQRAYIHGDRVKLPKARLRVPRNFGNENGFDYKSYLANKGIFITSWSGTKAEVVVTPGENSIVRRFATFRRAMTDFVFSAHFLPAYVDTGQTKALVAAMAFGDTARIDDETARDFRRSGTAHLLSVSGLHVGFMAGATYYFFRAVLFGLFFRYRRGLALDGLHCRIAAILSIPAVVAYAGIVGDKISCERAAVMATAVLIAAAIGRTGLSLHLLFLAGIGILLTDPQALFDISFQLSFAAVAAITIGAKSSSEDLPEDSPLRQDKEDDDDPEILKTRWQILIERFRESSAGTALKFSLLAALGTLPITAYYFNQVVLAGLVANAIAIPLSAVTVSTALAASIATPASSTLAQLAYIPSALTAHMTLLVAHITASLPFAAIRLPSISVITVVLFYVLLAAAFFHSRIERATGKLTSLFLAIVAAFSIVASIHSDWAGFGYKNIPPGGARIDFIDIGQGDATLIRFAGIFSILVDAGSRHGGLDAGEDVIAPFVRAQRMWGIDELVVTHSDSDHIGGVASVIRELGPRHCYYPAIRLDNATVAPESKQAGWRNASLDLAELLAGCDTIYGVMAGETLIVPDGVGVEVLNPQPDTGGSAASNTASIVLKLTIGKTTVLLPGDIDGRAEKMLVEKYGDKLRADILKAPHHGSKHSSSDEFLAAVSPQTVVVSAGYMNRFGHPARESIDRYARRGIKVLRTDTMGAIRIDIGPEGYTAGSFLPEIEAQAEKKGNTAEKEED